MTSDEAPDRLRQLLRDAGVDLDQPTSGDVAARICTAAVLPAPAIRTALGGGLEHPWGSLGFAFAYSLTL
jgi:hypothetical protein